MAMLSLYNTTYNQTVKGEGQQITVDEPVLLKLPLKGFCLYSGRAQLAPSKNGDKKKSIGVFYHTHFA